MEIGIAVNEKLISRERAVALAEKKAKRLGIEPVVTEAELCYKKMYFVKIMAYASRIPFPPKKIGYVIYYDSVLDRGGLTDHIPETKVIDVDNHLIFESIYTLEDLQKKKADFIEKYILKNYLLKRPDLEEKGTEEVYLPYWTCKFAPNKKQEGILINAATGRYNI